MNKSWRALCAGLALASSLASAAGCSSAGLHLPGSIWPRKAAAGPAGASAALPDESLNAVPYVPPPPEARSADTIDSVVASVDGNPITSRDVATFGSAQRKAGAAAGEAGEASSDVPDEPNARLKALITQQLIQQEAQKYAGKVDDADVDRFILGIEDRNHLTEGQLRAQIQAQGMSYAQFRANIRRQVQTMAMFQHEVRDKVAVSDADIAAYYKDHADEFNVTEEKYRLAQILIATPKEASAEQVAAAKHKAEEVQAKAVKGEDFAELARRYSDDDSKSNGGELGQFDPQSLNDDVAAGIKNVKVGEVSAVIRTKYGFHIIKVEDHQVPGGMKLSEVKGQIRQKLQSDRSKDDFDKWVDRDLVKEHYVETAE